VERRLQTAIATTLLLAALPVAAEIPLVNGTVANRSEACGEARDLVVQVSGGSQSVRIAVPAGASAALGLSREVHRVLVTDSAGTLVEETLLSIREEGFRLEVGCSGGSLKTAAEVPRSEPSPGKGSVAVTLANTTPSCGRPEDAEFRIQGMAAGTLKPGETRKAALPSERPLVVDVFTGGRRQWTFSAAKPRDGETWAYGCTQPDLARAAEGIPVAFENTTDQCPEPAGGIHLTLWVDGQPVIGLAPGGRTAVRVAPGLHHFEVRPGLTMERLVRGQRDVQATFRIHYGCGR